MEWGTKIRRAEEVSTVIDTTRMQQLRYIARVSLLATLLVAVLSSFLQAQTETAPGSVTVPPQRPQLVVQASHPEGIRQVAALSLDGRLIVIGSGSACVRDIATGGEIRCFEGHAGEIRAVAFSPDGQLVATGGSDKTARVWEVVTGKEVRRFLHPSFTSDTSEVAFSPDSRFLMTNTIRAAYLWDITTGKEVWRIEPEGRSIIQRVAFSPTGRFVLTVWDYFASDVRLWDMATGKEVRRLINPTAKISVSSVAFSPDEQYVLTGSKQDTTVRLWEAATGREVRRFDGHADTIYDVAFSSDGRLVLTLEGAKVANPLTVHFWDAATGHHVRRLVTDYKCCHAFFAAAGRFALGFGGGALDAQVWDTTTEQQVQLPAPQSLSVNAMTFSPNKRWVLLGNHDGELRLWDTATGRVVQPFAERSGSLAFSPDSRLLLTVGYTPLKGLNKKTNNNFAQLWDVQTGQEVQRFIVSHTNDLWRSIGPSPEVWSVAFSPDGQLVATASTDFTVRLWQVASGQEIQRFSIGHLPFNVAFSPDGQFLLIMEGGSRGKAILRRIATGDEVWKVQHDPQEFFEAFSADGRFVILRHDRAVNFLDAATGQKIRSFQYAPYGFGSSVMHVSSQGRFVLTKNPDGSVSFRDFLTGKETRRIEEVDWARLSSDEQLMITRSGDVAHLWDVTSGRKLCQLISFRDGTWVVVDPEGRFDTNNLDNNRGLHWVMPDDPLTPLPLEIFMRDYYEPRLLPRILAGEKFWPVQSLTELNRVQPLVKISKITSLPDTPDMVAVSVEVAKASREFQRGGKKVVEETGANDLRLFRDGQLVGYAPKTEGEISLDAQTGATTHTFIVRLPRTETKQIEFSAYAFNVDRVKSATDRKTFTPPMARKPVKGRAYLLNVGVNAYENPAWNLRFAANDARQMQRLLHDRLRRTGAFETVVPLLLITDAQEQTSETKRAEPHATKDTIRAVLDLLAGKDVDRSRFPTITNSDLLQPTRPEDLVLLTFSSHGHADAKGEFYLFPFDIGPGQTKAVTPELLDRTISSDELSHWLRDVDAGEIVLIVDACHSAASVEGEGFKPGPMGSRGLGQLAYDKGMRILTASQADDVAIESQLLQQGLLTYALTQEGLEAGQADFQPKDRTITLTEWLRYGAERVPQLYAEVRSGQLQESGQPKNTRAAVAAVVEYDPQGSSLKKGGFQQPALFDFARRQRDTILTRGRTKQ